MLNELQNTTMARQSAMDNPFNKHKEMLLNADYSTAIRLRQLALHLFNDDNKLDSLSRLLANADERHLAIAFSMLRWYAIYGENDAVFIDVCRQVAKKWS
ncbi:MAG: hypothetical protein J5I92_16860 [Thiogranum sp.]|nr:hypothetical protein [Thiogranum sp.]